AELRHQVHRESGFAVVFFDDGKDFVVNELASGPANKLFFVVEQGIEFDEIQGGEGWHERLRRARVTKGRGCGKEGGGMVIEGGESDIPLAAALFRCTGCCVARGSPITDMSGKR